MNEKYARMEETGNLACVYLKNEVDKEMSRHYVEKSQLNADIRQLKQQLEIYENQSEQRIKDTMEALRRYVIEQENPPQQMISKV